MRVEVKSLSSNETLDWNGWIPSDPSNVMHWFTVRIGSAGQQAGDDFQVAVATRQAIDQRTDKRRPFRGLILDPFEKAKVELLIQSHVENIAASTWDEAVKQLRNTMNWEYE